MANLTKLHDWLNATIDALEQEQAQIVLRINGGAIDAVLETTQSWVDSKGRLVQVDRSQKTHLQIVRTGRVLKK